MKPSNQFTCFRGLIITLLASACVFLPSGVRADEPAGSPSPPAAPQQFFATPDQAVAALQSAAATKDQAALESVFGPEFKELMTGDRVQDSNNAEKFATAVAESCSQVKDGDSQITLEIGTNNWPMPIPLVMTNGQWFFDTAAGKEEIINRHIGQDELCAIGVCRAYVTAQKQYAGMNPLPGGGAKYAQKFKSTPGQKDGLYWPAADNESASPFGPLVAEAHAEGYGHNQGTGLHAFHGYYFRILTRQGAAASGGKMNYLVDGNLTGGFALVAYPESWDQSGVMTFIVNQDGKVYQQNLGEKTPRIAGAMKFYNPDNGWTLVEDDGDTDTVLEK